MGNTFPHGWRHSITRRTPAAIHQYAQSPGKGVEGPQQCDTNEVTLSMEKTQALRKPVESRRALQHRQKTLALGIFLVLGIAERSRCY